MSRVLLVRASLCALVALAVGLGLISSPRPAAAADDTVTTELQPGLNLAGWTEDEASIEAIFDKIPELDLVYAWDPEDQWFRWAARTETGVIGGLRRLAPGMGLFLSITGEETVPWTRPLVREAGIARLSPGWNLVTWAGDDGAATNDALRDVDDILTESAGADGAEPAMLARGGALWLNVSADWEWDQQFEPPRIEFLLEFPEERQNEVRAYVDDLVEFFHGRLGVRASGVTIRYGDGSITVCGQYHSRTHTISIRDDGCFRALAHEYVHALQGRLAANSDLVPSWLVEGSADYWADVYRDETQSEDYLEEFRLLARRVERLAFIPAHPTYDVAHLAAHTLIKRVGEDRVVSYFRALSEGQGFGWQDPFRSTFGLDPAQFYLEFATLFSETKHSIACPVSWYEPGQQRAEPPDEACRNITGVVTDLNGRPRSGILVEAVPIEGFGGETAIASIVTGRDGRFALVLPSGSYLLGLKADFRTVGTTNGGRSYFGGSTGFTNHRHEATRLSLSDRDAGNIVIAQAAVSGVVRGKAGEPLRGVTILLVQPPGTLVLGGTAVNYRPVIGFPRQTEESGEFKMLVGPGTYKAAVICGENFVRGTFAGWFAGEQGLTDAVDQAMELVVETADITGIVVDVPFTHAEVKEESCSPVEGQRAALDAGAPAIPGPSSAFNAAGWIEPVSGISPPQPDLARVQGEEQGQTQSPLEDEEDADEDETYVPPRIEFVMDVTPGHKDEVRALVDDVVDFFHQRLGVRASGLTIRYGDLSILVCGLYEPETHTITMAHPGICFHLIPHEYVHALQGQLRERTHLGPPWIVEGAADYWAAIYYDATGGDDYVTQFQSVARYARNIGFIPTGSDYSVGHMGVHYLAKRFGEEALTSYFRDPLEPARDGWNSEFEKAFSISLKTFYIEFAREMTLRRHAVACPVSWYAPGQAKSNAPAEDCRRVEGTVTDLEGAPRSGVYVEATTERHGRYFLEGIAFDATDDDGTFALVLPQGSYRVVACIPGKSPTGSPCHATTLHRPGYVRGQDINLQFRDRTDVGISLGSISGKVVGKDEEPIRNMRLELLVPLEDVPDARDVSTLISGVTIERHGKVHLAQKRTAGDGGFQWLVPRGVYRIVVLCTGGEFVGWYGGSSGLTSLQRESTAITIDTTDVTDIVIQLPVMQEEARSGRCVAAE